MCTCMLMECAAVSNCALTLIPKRPNLEPASILEIANERCEQTRLVMLQIDAGGQRANLCPTAMLYNDPTPTYPPFILHPIRLHYSTLQPASSYNCNLKVATSNGLNSISASPEPYSTSSISSSSIFVLKTFFTSSVVLIVPRLLPPMDS